MKRSLLLAGGGMKVAFQAGVLQVLLTEAKLRFDHIDACSGGAFNLAMLCDGRTGEEIADAWRQTRPRDGVSARIRDLVRIPFFQPSLITLDAYRTKVFRTWGLDFDRIRRSQLTATFTAYNTNSASRVTFAPEEMTEDRLVACLSQAVWFPPVVIDGEIHTDAVFDTDANFEAAIDRGAEEIWVIWTVSRRAEWMPGLIAQFFHALEVSANGTLAADIRWAESQGVKVRKIEAEVPVHYLLLFGSDRLHRAVERGVVAGRRFLDEQWLPYRPLDKGRVYDDDVVLRFSDHLAGRLGGKKVDIDLTLVVEDAGEFCSAGRQRGLLEGGVSCSLLGGVASVVGGWAEILVDDGKDPTSKRMVYVLHLRASDGRTFTLTGLKELGPKKVGTAYRAPTVGEVWRDATTMQLRLDSGHVDLDYPENPLATGIGWMTWRDVLSQFLTARASGPGLVAEVKGLARYGSLFAGSLWDVCARRISTYAPF